MTESSNVSQPVNKNDIWDYIKDNPRMLGFPLSEKNGLDIFNALRDIWLEIERNPKAAANMLTILVSVIMASVMGHGDEAVEEVLVQDAMFNFDREAKDVLDEG